MNRLPIPLFAIAAFVVASAPAASIAAVCSAGGTASGACGGVPEGFEGCCTADGRSDYCESGVLCVLNCPANPTNKACGWDAAIAAYNCVAPQGVVDPTCGFPMMCPADCEPCVGGVDDYGCCSGSTVTRCECGCLRTIDCSTNPAGLRTCGWDSYNYIYDCGQSGEDPSGYHPQACSGSCTPDCFVRNCGSDGCGDACGYCDFDQVCDDTGWCCTPDCTFSDCGDDGCGGSCGTCSGGDTCDFGTCTGSCTPDCFGKECGDNGCGGSCGLCAIDQTCASVGVCFGGSCTVDCAGRDCGDDGCSGSCGLCQDGYSCDNGTCTLGGGCVSACNGLQCGTDGCGGSCGQCLDDQFCQSGICVAVPPCTKQCTDKACGDDGCGGQCGTCGVDEACQGSQCVDAKPCEILCTGRKCGTDGCGGACGACFPPEKCSDNGRCYDVAGCVPACNGRQCGGDDGCGGSCGTCRSRQECGIDGMCVDIPGAGVDATGGTGDVPGGQTCPAGTVLSYGSCVSVVVPVAGTGGGCSAGPVAPLFGHFMPLLLALLAMAGVRRRFS